jgi:hypothetical protein
MVVDNRFGLREQAPRFEREQLRIAGTGADKEDSAIHGLEVRDVSRPSANRSSLSNGPELIMSSLVDMTPFNLYPLGGRCKHSPCHVCKFIKAISQGDASEPAHRR